MRAAYPALEVDTATGVTVAVAGRIQFVRNGGKLCFATLRDGAGDELQAMLSLDRVGAQSLADWKAQVDLGDHVGVVGEVISSRRGELSVLVDRWEITAKTLRPRSRIRMRLASSSINSSRCEESTTAVPVAR